MEKVVLSALVSTILIVVTSFDDWHFQGENIALHKYASQQYGTYMDGNAVRYPASLAVDGNTDGNFNVGKSCSHTSDEYKDGDASWTVDLGRPYYVKGIVIYNRKANTCSLPSAPSNSQFVSLQIKKIYTEKSEVKFKCHTGYKLKGSNSLTCGEQNWTDRQDACQRVYCEKADGFFHGYYVDIDSNSISEKKTKFHYDEGIVPVCNNGYELELNVNLGVRRCGADSMWTGNNPKCAKIMCMVRLAVPYGKITNENGRIVTSSSIPYGTSITVECDQGYRLKKEGSQQCLLNKTLSNEIPECVLVTCDQPVRFAQGYFIDINNKRIPKTKTIFRYNESIVPKCSHGYELESKEISYVRRCDVYGQWTGRNPKGIQIKCNIRHKVLHGVITYKNGSHVTSSSIPYGEFITAKCDHGYSLEIKRSRQCLPNKTLSNEPLVCVLVTCDHPDNFDQGYYTYFNDKNILDNKTVFQYNESIVSRCNHEYELKENLILNVRRCDADGQWTGKNPECVQIKCSVHHTVPNGIIIYENGTNVTSASIAYGENVTLKCDDGYRLEYEGHRQCLVNKTLSNVPLVCVLVTCDLPGNLVHGYYIDTNNNIKLGNMTKFRYNMRIITACVHGYELESNNKSGVRRRCGADGTWTINNPKCVQIKCNIKQTVPHGSISYEDGRSVTSSSIPYGAKITVKCDQGYRLEYEGSRQCLLNKTLSNEPLVCVLVTCDHPGIFDQGYYTYFNYNNIRNNKTVFQYNESIVSTCNHGFELEENGISNVRRCDADGKWTGKNPECVQIKCYVNHTVPNGIIIYENGTKLNLPAYYTVKLLKLNVIMDIN